MRNLLIGIAGMTLASSAAAAQPAGGRSDPLGVEAVHNFGRCAADRSPDAARKILAMDHRTEAYGRALRRFIRGHNYCGGGSYVLKAGSLLFAGSLAEALVEQGKTTGLAARLAQQPATPLTARGELEMTAICTANRASGQVATLLATKVQSAEESAALDALMPSVAGCLAGKTTLRVNRPAIRSLLALAAWRLTEGRAG